MKGRLRKATHNRREEGSGGTGPARSTNLSGDYLLPIYLILWECQVVEFKVYIHRALSTGAFGELSGIDLSGRGPTRRIGMERD